MATFTGTSGNDILPSLLGTAFALGDDRIDALGGDDIAFGWTGDDTIEGGAGADVLIGGLLNVTANVGTTALAGNDTVSYEGSSAGVSVDLSDRNDTTVSLLGLEIGLTDAVAGSGGDAEGDLLTGFRNLTGSAHADRLGGDELANVLEGGAGDDVLTGGGGADTLVGGDGIDWADYTASTAGVQVLLGQQRGVGGDAEGDTFSGIENVYGSHASDVLTGDANANHLFGSSGADYIVGGAGADRLDGGTGVEDTVDYAESDAGVFVNMLTGAALHGDAEGDTVLNFEHIVGSDFADILIDNGFANRLEGGGGNDSFVLSFGTDHVEGGDDVDAVFYTHSPVGVLVDLDSGFGIGGHASQDTYVDVENASGSQHRDILIGGEGLTHLQGLGGVDDFVIKSGGGRDIIQDFVTSGDEADRLDLRDHGFESVDEAMALATDTDDGIRFDFAPGDTVLLAGVHDMTGLVDDILV